MAIRGCRGPVSRAGACLRLSHGIVRDDHAEPPPCRLQRWVGSPPGLTDCEDLFGDQEWSTDQERGDREGRMPRRIARAVCTGAGWGGGLSLIHISEPTRLL